jgi:hypothetical protein
VRSAQPLLHDTEEDRQIFGGNDPPAGHNRTHPAVENSAVEQACKKLGWDVGPTCHLPHPKHRLGHDSPPQVATIIAAERKLQR